MKLHLSLGFLLVLAFPAFGCDEACQREKASVKNNIEIPGYLSWKFCEETKASFIDADIPSLANYRNERLSAESKRRMKNIQTFIEQRKEWLLECDNYFAMTEHGRIFENEATTKQIFAAMDAVASELGLLLKGVTYVSNGQDQDEMAIIGTKFDSMFKLVDDHKTRMMVKGQFVRN